MSCQSQRDISDPRIVAVASPIEQLLSPVVGSVGQLLILTEARSDGNRNTGLEEIVSYVLRRCVFDPIVVIVLYRDVECLHRGEVEIDVATVFTERGSQYRSAAQNTKGGDKCS